MKLDVRTQSQRDSRWGSQILGYNTNPIYSIYNYGCLITSLGNYVGKDPAEVNQLLKDNGGYLAGSGNFIWSKSTVLGITQTYISPYYDAEVTSQGITKIKEYIGQGIPLICEVDFNPADTVKQQHFVLLSGVDDAGNVLVVDPWEGQWETWSEATCKRNIYQFRSYNKKLPSDVVVDQECMPKDQAEDYKRCKEGWNKVREKLNVEDNVTVVLAEIDKLIKYEDAVIQKDKQLTDAQVQVNVLNGQLKELLDSHNTLQTSYNDLQGQLNTDKATIDTLTKNLAELEAKIIQPVYKGWKKALIDFISKI